jgi:hypothetical protein
MVGVFVNWIALAVAIIVSFFLSPFVVLHLRDVAYDLMFFQVQGNEAALLYL